MPERPRETTAMAGASLTGQGVPGGTGPGRSKPLSPQAPKPFHEKADCCQADVAAVGRW
jgi:hypothetical protein